jgi:hypothetical protein
MYFPYFRGRQYELLALKELAQNGLLGKSVLPVVEPVKLSSTFENALKSFIDTKLPVALVVNPAVGDLSDETNSVASLSAYLGDDSGVIPSVILNETAESALAELAAIGLQKHSVLTIFDNRDFLDDYKTLFNSAEPRYTLFPDERQIRRAVQQHKVLFEDKFHKQLRNADYPDDEFFSEDHLYFKDEGYDGFGDYSIIGNEYQESGFAPRAVAIHIVYFDKDNNLRVRHFKSNTNDDISDVARKFYEAVSKLYSWFNAGQTRQLTTGLKILLSHYENGTYPGLPTLKKLSIMHHLEIMGKFLDGSLPE